MYHSQLASQSYTFTAWHVHLLDDNTSSTQCGSHGCFEISMGVQPLLWCRWTCLVGRQSAVGNICPCWTDNGLQGQQTMPLAVELKVATDVAIWSHTI